MKRTLLIVAASLLAASCGRAPIEPDPTGTPEQQLEARAVAGDPVAIEQRDANRIAQNVADHLTWTDPVTGCDYVAPGQSSSYGSMPRVDRDGISAYCAEQKARDAAEALARGCTRPRMSDGSYGPEQCLNINEGGAQ